jgi:exonuclease SbcC
MFEFFFKRSANKLPSQEATNKMPEPDSGADLKSAREAALAQAAALSGNEAAAVEFVLQCAYADARFEAAQHVYSKAMLERVAQAMRNTDRRVVKLVQGRLDAILLREKAERQADECIRQAQHLLEEPNPVPNRVADLDRAWAEADAASPALRDSFERARTALRERLEAQAALQRAMIDLCTKLEKLTRAAIEAPHVFTPERLRQSLDSLEQEMAQYCADREAPSLPQHLLSEFARRRDDFRMKLASIEESNQATAAREATLAGWEATPPADLNESVLRRVWQALPPLQEDKATAFDTRFNALLERVTDTRKPKTAVRNNADDSRRKHLSEALDKMEKALEDGALQIAVDQDKALRAVDSEYLPLSNAQTARLAKARSELHRLQGWARWGGNISREELLKAAEELPSASHGVSELAKKVGGLRERWKSLDMSAGSAGKELWERFDAACTAAYAPVAAHFKKLADERQGNLDKARSIIADVRRFAAESGCAEAHPDQVDWKAVAGFATRTAGLWQRLGPIDRKERKSVKEDFSAAMRLLSEPLAAQREIETARREKLIAEAIALSPADRRAPDALRILQERWQERAKALPLERKVEQALWQRFRGACDAVFAKRKEAAQAADADRQAQLLVKEALCASLEAFTDDRAEGISKKLREAREAWGRTGPVPRASEHQIEKRYQTAISSLQKRMKALQRSMKEKRLALLNDKLKRCHTVEEQAATGRMPDDDQLSRLQADWQALPELPSAWERALRARFDDATAALKAADRSFASLLRQNLAVLERDVLRLELIAGLDSPPELSQERLQLQVEVLQSSLKSKQPQLSQQEQLLRACALPALTDQQLGSRLARLAARIDAFDS